MKGYRIVYDTLEDKGLFVMVYANSVEEAKNNACKLLQKDVKTFMIRYVLDSWGASSKQ